MKRDHVISWADEHLPGEPIEAYVVGRPAPGASMDASDGGSGSHPADLPSQVALRGLDQGQRVWNGLSSVCLILTGRQLAVVSLGGLMTAKPKQMLHSGPLDGLRCEWWVDDASAGARYHNWLIFFADGRWAAAGTATRLLGKTVTSADLAEEFTAALGPAATEFDWRHQPSR